MRYEYILHSCLLPQALLPGARTREVSLNATWQLAPISRSKRLFSWQKFWRNDTVTVSLLFGKYCPIIV
jgi:hypothetical protein